MLWLLGHGVRAQCFRVVPYSFGEELFVDLQQIIPTPEAADYMIGMAAKDSETQSVEGARKRSDRVRHAFWTKALEELRARNVSRFENISPSTDHWLSCATGVSGCAYSLIFLNEARVELTLQRSVRDAVKRRLIGFDAVKHLLLARIERRPVHLDLSRYPHLPQPFVAATRSADYATLLAGGAGHG